MIMWTVEIVFLTVTPTGREIPFGKWKVINGKYKIRKVRVKLELDEACVAIQRSD